MTLSKKTTGEAILAEPAEGQEGLVNGFSISSGFGALYGQRQEICMREARVIV